jgi:hypothetical protein
MSVTNLVLAWLTLLTIAQCVFIIVVWYLFKTGDETRIEAMRLRARLNAVAEQGNQVRLKKSFLAPPPPKVEIDLSHLEYVDDDLNG